MKFSYRRYQAGDEVAINELYHAVTGRIRTQEQYAWQWLDTPAGESEIWLIEAELDDGKTKLIGHHGIMALEFSNKGIPLRVGKTENTMVLQDFRKKILYPRYEKIFLSHYEGKFHALFSTSGPSAAMRVRKAMGYVVKYRWHKIYIGREPLLSMIGIAGKIARQFGMQYSEYIEKAPESIVVNGTRIDAYLGRDAALDFNFDDFWNEVSPKYPMTPARTKKNISWRFWDNPYRQHITLILNSELFGTAVCVLSFRERLCVFIEDIYSDDMNSLAKFLEAVYIWARRNFGKVVLEFSTTSDNMKYFRQNEKIKNTTWYNELIGIFMQGNDAKMPRKITSIGEKDLALSADDWFVTPFIFEGR